MYYVDVIAWAEGKADMQFWLLDRVTHAIEEDASWPTAWKLYAS